MFLYASFVLSGTVSCTGLCKDWDCQADAEVASHTQATHLFLLLCTSHAITSCLHKAHANTDMSGLLLANHEHPRKKAHTEPTAKKNQKTTGIVQAT